MYVEKAGFYEIGGWAFGGGGLEVTGNKCPDILYTNIMFIVFV